MYTMTASQKDKTRIIALLLALAMVFIVVIFINAYSAKLQYQINTINGQIQERQREILNLQVKIKSATNINNLEQRAFELGLVYPGFDEIIYIQNDENSIQEFALALKETVYNQ